MVGTIPEAHSEYTSPGRGWQLSVALLVTLGWLPVTCFLVAIFYSFPLALAFPFLSALLMKLSHMVVVKAFPRKEDPHFEAIQMGIIVGGLISVALAYFGTGVVSWKVLAYSGLGISGLALLIIALDVLRFRQRQNAASKVQQNIEEAKNLILAGEYTSANEMLQEALLASEVAYGSNHPQVATIVTILGELMRVMERTTAALAMYRRACKVHANLRRASPDFVHALLRYAEYQREHQLFEEARVSAERAIAESRRLNNEELTGHCTLTLARIQSALGNLPAANDSARAAAKLLDEVLGSSHPKTLQARSLMANFSINLGRIAEAERILLEVVREKDLQGANDDEDYLYLLLDLQKVQSRDTKSEARTTLLKAIELYRSEVGPNFKRAAEINALGPKVLAPPQHPKLEALYQALFEKDASGTRRVLDEDPSLAKCVDLTGWTPLQWAAFFDQGEIIAMLLARGADVEYARGSGLPTLYVAARWARRAALTTLFRDDLDVEIEASDGSRPLHGAAKSGDNYVFDLIWGRKADVTANNHRGWTPMHEAAFIGDRKLLLELISEGFDVDFQGGSLQETPLHAAILGGHHTTAEALLLNLANIRIKDAKGVTPLQLAQNLNRKEILRLFQSQVSSQVEGQSIQNSGSASSALSKEKVPN